jgi:hypothetical protein
MNVNNELEENGRDLFQGIISAFDIEIEENHCEAPYKRSFGSGSNSRPA